LVLVYVVTPEKCISEKPGRQNDITSSITRHGPPSGGKPNSSPVSHSHEGTRNGEKTDSDRPHYQHLVAITAHPHHPSWGSHNNPIRAYDSSLSYIYTRSRPYLICARKTHSRYALRGDRRSRGTTGHATRRDEQRRGSRARSNHPHSLTDAVVIGKYRHISIQEVKTSRSGWLGCCSLVSMKITFADMLSSVVGAIGWLIGKDCERLCTRASKTSRVGEIFLSIDHCYYCW